MHKILALELNLEANNGNKYNKYTFEETQTKQKIQATCWIPLAISAECNKVGNIVEAKLEQKGQFFDVKSMFLIEEGFSGLTEDMTNIYFIYMIEKLKQNKHKDESLYLRSLMLEHKKLFMISPAAKSHHHNYRSGLLQHIFEIINFGERNMDPEMDMDLFFLAAIAHDFFKIYEYTIDDSGSISMNEEWIAENISHTAYMFAELRSQGFIKLSNMVASHHKSIEWGAIRDLENKYTKPMPEEWLLHLADMYSAKLGAITLKRLELICNSKIEMRS